MAWDERTVQKAEVLPPFLLVSWLEGLVCQSVSFIFKPGQIVFCGHKLTVQTVLPDEVLVVVRVRNQKMAKKEDFYYGKNGNLSFFLSLPLISNLRNILWWRLTLNSLKITFSGLSQCLRCTFKKTPKPYVIISKLQIFVAWINSADMIHLIFYLSLLNMFWDNVLIFS